MSLISIDFFISYFTNKTDSVYIELARDRKYMFRVNKNNIHRHPEYERGFLEDQNRDKQWKQWKDYYDYDIALVMIGNLNPYGAGSICLTNSSAQIPPDQYVMNGHIPGRDTAVYLPMRPREVNSSRLSFSETGSDESDSTATFCRVSNVYSKPF